MKARLGSALRMLFFLLSFVVLLAALPISGFAAKTQSNTIRVGYPVQRGLTMKDADGNLSGYTYDYLMEISQYTGWNYEFVFFDGTLNEQISGLMTMLENGEIDLLGSMYYDESLTGRFSYPGYCYGLNYSGLFVSEQSRLRESSLYSAGALTVGVFSKLQVPNAKLEQFAQMNNLEIEQVLASSAENLYYLLDAGRVDAILSTDLSVAERSDLYPVAHFSPMPFYFTTTKGNTNIVQQLDYALSTIDRVNPNFMSELYNAYFSPATDSVVFSSQEMNYISTRGVLDVVMYDNKPPFQYLDQATGKPVGITVEVLELISEASGLTFQYHTVSTYQEYLAALESGEVDIAADMLINYQDALDTKCSLTLPWSSLPVSLFFRDDRDLMERGRVAVPYYFKNAVDTAQNVVYYNTAEECLRAVQNGSADYGYSGEFCAQYLFGSLAYNDLKKLHQTDIPNQNVCFGICDAGDLDLLSIFNKCITSISKDTLNEIVYRNTYQRQPVTLELYLRTNGEFLIIIAMALFAIFLVVFFYNKERQRQRIEFENIRYSAVSNLANEHFYEYNVRQDELILSEKCADFFGCKQKIEGFSHQLSQIDPEERSGIWQFGDAIISAKEGSLELSCPMPDGSRRWFKVFSSVIYNKKSQVYAVGKIADIQETKAEKIRLEQEAMLDGLTGIYNIATVKRLIQDQLSQFDFCSPCALLILDIDKFKQINDTYGHYSGDSVLVQAANLILSTFPNGLAGRLGGDEFVVFVPHMEPYKIKIYCDQLCTAMTKTTELLLGTPFSWSIGVVPVRRGQTYDELYQEADAALYRMKTAGKNGYAFSTDLAEDSTEPDPPVTSGDPA